MLDENLIVDLARRKVVAETFRRLPGDKKNLVYRTAVRLFGKYGYDGLAVDRFCREAGISKGSFFQYFETKSHLLEFVLLSFDQRVAAWIDRIRREETAVLARDRLAYLFRATISESDLDNDEASFFHFATRALTHSTVVIEGVNLSAHVSGYVTEIIERGVATGELADDPPAAKQIAVIGRILEDAMTWRLSPSEAGVSLRHDILLKVLLEGIRS
jgi:AcrR family transcriptional regulator